MTEIITSKDNPTVKLYRKLSESRKERKNLKMFVLEGLRLVTDAINENADIVTIIVTQDASSRFTEQLSQVDLKERRIVVISNGLGTKISMTEKTQGIFAICREKQPLQLEKCIKTDGKYIILYQLQDPGNAGMIIRTADAMGIDGLIFSESCDIFSPKTIRATMGSIFRMPVWNNQNIDEVIRIFKEKNIEILASVIDADAESIKEHSFKGGCGVIIGNEGNGVPKEVSAECDGRLTIKMHGNINSFNAAMATGIIMWEMTDRTNG